MHAELIVARFVEQALSAIHGGRRRVLAVVVWAAMSGSALSLTQLARGVARRGGTTKCALKRVDRLIGHARVEQEVEVVAEALLARLCTWLSPLVIAVDWSATSPGGSFVELRAAVVWLGMGRGVTVFQRVYPMAKQASGAAEAALLQDLARWIPAGQRVIVISDAGFHTPWFKVVQELGWSWIGRVRGGNQVCIAEGIWQDAVVWGRAATARADRLKRARLTRVASLACGLVRVRRRAKGRVPYRRPGHGPTRKAGAEARASAREGWVLAHSTDLQDMKPEDIVALYGRRMQIEENFRDAKSLQFGMGAEVGRSRSALRLQALLLIATVASYLLWHLGQLAEAEGLHRRYKATTRAARELSVIAVALQLCSEGGIPFSPEGARALRRKLGVDR